MIHSIYFRVDLDGVASVIINDVNRKARHTYAIGDKINGAKIVHFAVINNTVMLACEDGNDYCYDDHFEYQKHTGE